MTSFTARTALKLESGKEVGHAGPVEDAVGVAVRAAFSGATAAGLPTAAAERAAVRGATRAAKEAEAAAAAAGDGAAAAAELDASQRVENAAVRAVIEVLF
jgi:hypothetical protein